jgi:23S rRNA pseudouridine2605 synthase
MKERLQKIIARSGIGSRRTAEQFIRQGRVMVNGCVVTQLGSLADPALDAISVDDVELAAPENRLYLLLHKPPGCVTSLHDPEGRATVTRFYDSIPERLYPVGRLDYDTEGLLVITNDGGFSQLLQHPRHGIEKKYLVKVKGVPLEAALKRLREGVEIDGRITSRAGVRLVKKGVRNSWCEVVLHEGLNRHHQDRHRPPAAGAAAVGHLPLSHESRNRSCQAVRCRGSAADSAEAHRTGPSGLAAGCRPQNARSRSDEKAFLPPVPIIFMDTIVRSWERREKCFAPFTLGQGRPLCLA